MLSLLYTPRQPKNEFFLESSSQSSTPWWPHQLLGGPINSLVAPSTPWWPHQLLGGPINSLVAPSTPWWPHQLLGGPINSLVAPSTPWWPHQLLGGPINSLVGPSTPWWPHQLLGGPINSLVAPSIPWWPPHPSQKNAAEISKPDACFAKKMRTAARRMAVGLVRQGQRDGAGGNDLKASSYTQQYQAKCDPAKKISLHFGSLQRVVEFMASFEDRQYSICNRLGPRGTNVARFEPFLHGVQLHTCLCAH